MAQGKVRKFNQQKGSGFIRLHDGRDVFFHYSQLVMDGFKTIEEGEEVEVSDEKFGAFRSALSKLYISRRVDSMTLQEILGRNEGRNRR